MRLKSGLQSDEESMDGSCLRSCVIVPRCGHGIQDPVHKTPRPHPRIYPRSDVAQYGASIISELTQWSGSLTHLASDLGQAHQKYICTVHLLVAYDNYRG
jgi:hypothetical protein